MVTRPADFDHRSPMQVLQLRLRDWMWPSAVALALVIPLLGRSSGPYPVGSVTDFVNTIGVPVCLGLLAFAGIRWCSIGWLRPGDPARRAGGRLSIARLLLDLPGLFVAGSAVWLVAMMLLAMFGVIELD